MSEEGKHLVYLVYPQSLLSLLQLAHKAKSHSRLSCQIYLNDIYAGLLTEDENGFTFAYDAGFLRSGKAEAVSLTLPLTDKPYHDTVLFPFFDGLIPEGWLLNIAENSWKINRRDRMSLLLACCKDCIGAVSVVEDEPDKPET